MVNCLLSGFGAGAFHCGVEIYNLEWSYADVVLAKGAKPKGPMTGVFVSRPRMCEGHTYGQTMKMGVTKISEEEFYKVIKALEKEWLSDYYDLTKRNCCHFCNELCQRLRVGGIPEWLNNLAGAGASAKRNAWEITDFKCCQTISDQMLNHELHPEHCCEAREGLEVYEDRAISISAVDARAPPPGEEADSDVNYLM